MTNKCPVDKYGNHNWARTPNGIRCANCGARR